MGYKQTSACLFIDLLLKVGNKTDELNVIKVRSAIALLMYGDYFNHLCPVEILAVCSDSYLVTACLVRHDDVENPFRYVRNVCSLSLSCLEHDSVSFLRFIWRRHPDLNRDTGVNRLLTV